MVSTRRKVGTKHVLEGPAPLWNHESDTRHEARDTRERDWCRVVDVLAGDFGNAFCSSCAAFILFLMSFCLDCKLSLMCESSLLISLFTSFPVPRCCSQALRNNIQPFVKWHTYSKLPTTPRCLFQSYHTPSYRTPSFHTPR